MGIKKILTIIILIFIFTNICTYSFATGETSTTGLSIDSLIEAMKSIIPQGLENVSSLAATVVVGLYRIVQIGILGCVLIRLTWHGIMYFATASMASPDELKKRKAQLVNYLIKFCGVLGVEALVELIVNTVVSFFTSSSE